MNSYKDNILLCDGNKKVLSQVKITLIIIGRAIIISRW